VAGKLPPDSFEYYLSLGSKRSYEAVAKKYGVSKRSVVKRATREGWQRRVAEIEAQAQEKATARAVETLEEVKTRHLKTFKAVQLKALESLKALRFETAMDVVKAMDIAARQERLALGEPSERTALSIEDTIKREYERWMVSAGDGATQHVEDGIDGDDEVPPELE
jgi:hypothetical protein